MSASFLEKTIVDPITMEIVRAGLLSAADEMKLNLVRSAYTALIYEAQDMCVAILDSKGRTIAQAAGLPLFLGTLGAAIEDGLELIGKEHFKPGDAIITNDPYTTGTHLHDVKVYSPIFFEGELVGFAAAMANLADIGGIAPGTWYPSTTELYQEGIRIRSLKLYREGQPNEDVFSFLKYNTRFPVAVSGDIRALVAACRTGEKRVSEIFEKYGQSNTLAYIDALIDHNERLSRIEIRKIPSGTYEAKGVLDNDGIELDKPIPLKLKILVQGDEMTIDFSEIGPMVKGPINCGKAASISAARTICAAATTPMLPVNEGNFRPLKVIIPDGSMLSAVEPAPVASYGLALITLIDMGFKALSHAIPERMPAGNFSDLCSLHIYGTDPETQQRYIFTEVALGGWGGRSFEDGESCLKTPAQGDTKINPVEVIESRFPVFVEKCELLTDSGGAGKFRGGLGYERVYRPVGHSPAVNLYVERTKNPAWGLFGGKTGSKNNALILQSPEEKEFSLLKCSNYPLKRGARLRITSGGGGGYGNPLEREPSNVEQDFLNGYISRDAAWREYGVYIDPETGQMDIGRTQEERSRRKK